MRSSRARAGQPQECFDSWIERLARRHEVTRAELVQHLGSERRLAALDLAGGPVGVRASDRELVVQLIARLIWATQTTVSIVGQTFVFAKPAALLPPQIRHYGCPKCWLGSLAAGRPLVIERTWILRLSWRCAVHGMVLSDLSRLAEGLGPKAISVWLSDEAQHNSAIYAQFTYVAGRLRANDRAVQRLITGKSAEGIPAVTELQLKDYLRRFAANDLHHTNVRTILLASMHSARLYSSLGYEKLFASVTIPRPGRRRRTKRPVGSTVTELCDCICALQLRRLPRMTRDLAAMSDRLEAAMRAARRREGDRQRKLALERLRAQVLAGAQNIVESRARALLGFHQALSYLQACDLADDNTPGEIGLDPREDWSEADPAILARQLLRRFRIAGRFRPVLCGLVG